MEKKKVTVELEVSSDLGAGQSIGKAAITIDDLLSESYDSFTAQVDAVAAPFCETVAKELYSQIFRTFAILRMSANGGD